MGELEMVGEIHVPAEMTPDEASDLISKLISANAHANAETYAAIGAVLSYMKGKLAHGEFVPWVESRYPWTAQWVGKLRKYSAWYYRNKKRLKLTECKADFTALVEMAQGNVSENAYHELSTLVSAGEILTSTEAKEIIKKHKQPKLKKSPYDENGVAQCFECGNYGKEDWFADPADPHLCKDCDEEEKAKQAEEEAQPAEDGDNVVDAVNVSPSSQPTLAELWEAASDEEKQLLWNETEGNEDASDDLFDGPEAEKEPEPEPEPYEEVLHWWGKCSDEERKKLAKKIPWKQFLPSSAFIPPTLGEVQALCDERGYTAMDPEEFINHYETVNWMVGKKKMTNWRTACANWESRAKKRKGGGFKPPTVKDIEAFIDEEGIEGISAQSFHNHYEANGWKIGRTYMKNWKAAVRKWENSNEEKKGEEELVDNRFRS